MSTAEQEILDPKLAGLLNNNTTARSIMGERRDTRLEPEDMRSRRFGYNPGFKITADPIHSGLQLAEIPPGQLILFESGPIMRQNPSVDKDDRDPPALLKELLAGHAMESVRIQNEVMGFRELRTLRGATDVQAVNLFYQVHPSLAECVEMGVIPVCPYEEENGGSCMTCRVAVLKSMDKQFSGNAESLYSEIKESVYKGRAEMLARWRSAVGEVASVKTGTNRRMALGELTADLAYFMHQLHERTPEEQELAKIAANAEAQANVMRDALAAQQVGLTQAIQAGSNAAALLAQQVKIDELEARLAAMDKDKAAEVQAKEPTATKSKDGK